MKMLKTLVFAMIGTLITTVAVYGASAPIGVTIDGMPVTFADAKPYIDSSSRTMIPVRAVSESMGGKVTWDDKTRTVTIVRQDKTVELEIGKKGILVNKVGAIMDTAAQITDSRTYVPLRFVGEALGMAVAWDGTQDTVVISTKPHTAPDGTTALSDDFKDVAFRKGLTLSQTKRLAAHPGKGTDKSMFPFGLQRDIVEGVCVSASEKAIVLKLSCGKLEKPINKLGHPITVLMKNGQFFTTGPLHIDQENVSKYPCLLKVGNVATEQDQTTTGPAEWVATYSLHDTIRNYSAAEVSDVLVWDIPDTGVQPMFLGVPITQIPEI